MASSEYNPTISEKKPRPLYVKKPSGKLLNYRQWFGYFLVVVFLIMPFIKINGEPFLLFNIIERKFVIFGTVFWPQDLHIFVFGMLIGLVFIVLFTVVYGRVWCGWACPQTIFLELIFRKIEYWIEGDANQQRKRDNGPNTSEKIFKKTLKHVIYFIISFFISNLFLAYVIGVDALYEIITEPVSQHIGGLVSMIVFTFLFYGVFAFVREIVCTHICPYGRLQGVLLDDQSLVVAYNYQRGEPRGKIKKGSEQQELGDCIDCTLCVQVCPTGIDIRDGLQLECVNCTACIDACDSVMEKINRPKRLIGFYSSKQIDENTNEKNTTRIIAYSIVLVILLAIFGWLILSRSEVGGTLLRAKGTSYQINQAEGTVSNLYNLELINKSNTELPFVLETEDPNFTIRLVNPREVLKPSETAQFSFFLISDTEDISTYKTDVRVKVISGERTLETLKTTFISPPGN